MKRNIIVIIVGIIIQLAAQSVAYVIRNTFAVCLDANKNPVPCKISVDDEAFIFLAIISALTVFLGTILSKQNKVVVFIVLSILPLLWSIQFIRMLQY